MLPCVGCVDVLESQSKSGAGVHISMVELTSLVVQAFPLFGSLINPNVVLAWMNFDIPLAMCEPTSVPLFLVGIIPNSRVVVLLRD